MQTPRGAMLPASLVIPSLPKTGTLTAKSRLMARTSYKIIIRDYSKNDDGNAPLMLQVFINGERLRLAIGVYVSPKYFDKENGCIKKSHAAASDLNMVIGKSLARANDIFVRYKLAGKVLTANIFKQEFLLADFQKNDFLMYMEKKIEQRRSKNIIDDLTRSTQRSILKKIRNYRSHLSFAELTKSFCDDFHKYLKERGDEPWTVWGAFKTLKAYVNIALGEGMIFENPFAQFKISVPKVKRDYLEDTEIVTLHNYFLSEDCKPSHQNVLRYFLFSCLTGLRISDITRIGHDNIINNELHFIPRKNRTKQEILRIPLTDEIRSLIITTDGKLFHTYADVYTNRLLKEIAKACGIKRNLIYHMARHSFATHAITSGVNILVLKELMGHTKLETTTIYTHVVQKKKVEGMQKMSGLLSSSGRNGS